MPIRVLPSNVVSQIAAGEVVERPASAVKELIENAIDAGATDIAVETRDGGRSFIRISDNGSGLPASEVELAFNRHATSKLASADDLTHIKTLGFRGEALASIASVAKVTCVSRSREETIGTRIAIEGGQISERGSIGAPAGTVVTVENLFYTVPARLKFLKSDTTERRQIDLLISRYAMAYPSVRFNLIQAGRTAFQTTGNGSLKDVLIAVYGLDIAEQMIELPPPPQPSPDKSGEGIKVSGFISAPALSRANRADMTIFVNGRWVQDRGLNAAVLQAYHTLLMVGRYPVCIVRVEIDPEDVDVNVHPAKTEVRFRSNDAVFRVVQRNVRRTLIDLAPIPQVQTQEPTSAWQPSFDRHDEIAVSRIEALRSLQPVDQDLANQSSVISHQPSSLSDEPSVVSGLSPVINTHQPSLPPLRVIGQIGAMYIIAEGPEGMYLIDQHAAHERVLYEKFMADKTSQHIAVQNLLDPLPMEFSPDESTLIEENIETLHTIGLHLDAFGGSTWLIRSIPSLLAKDDI
ncbi:MAG TPA: DNA mismatch repair endonuclease MutL, partial [Anaerolineae bacterium]|nr:DNA mismatch repair endonuclease MutL [Anaerolineae bacterium]